MISKHDEILKKKSRNVFFFLTTKLFLGSLRAGRAIKKLNSASGKWYKSWIFFLSFFPLTIFQFFLENAWGNRKYLSLALKYLNKRFYQHVNCFCYKIGLRSQWKNTVKNLPSFDTCFHIQFFKKNLYQCFIYGIEEIWRF